MLNYLVSKWKKKCFYYFCIVFLYLSILDYRPGYIDLVYRRKFVNKNETVSLKISNLLCLNRSLIVGSTAMYADHCDIRS